MAANPARAQAGASYEAVAFSGQAAPGGEAFGSFGLPRLGADGTVAFVDQTFASESESLSFRVIATKRGNAQVVAASGQPSSTGDVAFSSFESPSVAADGRVAFSGFFRDIETFESFPAVWAQGVGQLAPAGGVSLGELGAVSYRSGRFAAIKGIADQGESQINGLYLAALGGVTTALRVNDKLPDLQYAVDVYEPDGSISFPSPSVAGAELDSNESGEVALKLKVGPSPSGTPAPKQAIYAGSPTALQVVAKEGDSAPGLPGFVYGDLSPNPSIASNGELAFSAEVFNNSQEQSRTVVFAGPRGALRPVVRSGDSVPGAPGVIFGDVFSSVVVNETGDVIFKARIDYPNEGSREGLWIQRRSGQPVLIAVSGIALPTPEGPRVVSAVDFAGPGTFSDLHQFVFRATFSSEQNSRDGIYLADTRAVVPWVRVNYPRKPRDRVTRDRFYTIRGVAEDDTGIAKVEYSVQREKNGKARLKARGKARKNKRFAAKSQPRLAKGDRDWEFRVPLVIGDNRIEVVATDRLGNVSEPLVLVIRRY